MRTPWLRAALELALPTDCASCGTPIDAFANARLAPLCDLCTRALPSILDSSCAGCDAPIADLTSDCLPVRCALCASRRSPLATCRAALWYEADVVRWVHAFKYPPPGLLHFDANAIGVARSFARLAAGRYRGAKPLVIPIPLHPRRMRQRSFNPALILARVIARELHAPLIARGLERTRDTPSQTGLDHRSRRRNVARAFRSRLGTHANEPILLVDDVVTTGSTLEEAARTLLRAGAKRVSAICIARTKLKGAPK